MNLRNKKSIEGARRQISGSYNQSAFLGPTSQIVQSDCSDGLRTNKSDRPIRLLWQDQQVVRTNQSSSTDLLSVLTNQSSSMDLLSVSSNQILRTDHLFVSANQILWTDLPTDHLLYRPIKSFGVSSAEIPKRSSHSNGHGPHELTSQTPFT